MTHDAYSTKRVTAWAAQRVLSDVPGGEPIPMDGFTVRYQDGYVSWCPKATFERDYQPVTAMSFGHAVHALKAGHRVARAGWNGKGMWLVLVKSWNGDFSGHELPVDWSPAPFIAMKTVADDLVPWLASQTDILADDWTLVD